MKVFVSYSKGLFVLHTNANCADIKLEAQADQRIVIITNDNMVDVLQLFIKQNWKFANTKGKEDLWLDITMNNPKLEESLVFVIRSILGSYYKPFAQSQVIFHC
jgi:hypothetical protein